jgi:exopolyphosphatase / guanosine-5'-triphosphate,3'-diphosphate pyrophosphatase
VTRVAVVDLGSNSTRLLVADVEGGGLHELARRLTVTRLGENVEARGQLAPAAIARVESCLTGYTRTAGQLGAERTLAFATSAVRDARNGAEFLAGIERRFCLPTRLLTGDEEALLTFAGVTAGRRLPASTLVVDLGGGSTELVIGTQSGASFHASVEVGCVRLTERFLAHDPPLPEEIGRLRDHVRRVIEAAAGRMDVRRAIGVAGTVISLATLDLGLASEDPARVHGHVMPRERIAREAVSLARTPSWRLRRRSGLHPDRAPVIAAGALALDEILGVFGLDELEVSEADVLQGVALALASGEAGLYESTSSVMTPR